MLEEKDIFDNEFERQYGDSYRQGEGHCTPPIPRTVLTRLLPPSSH